MAPCGANRTGTPLMVVLVTAVCSAGSTIVASIVGPTLSMVILSVKNVSIGIPEAASVASTPKMTLVGPGGVPVVVGKGVGGVNV